MDPLRPIIALIVAFVSGSFPTALIMGKMNGVDLRKVGSGNIGATNALRTLGWKWGIPCLVIDALKGWGPAFGFASFTPASISPQIWMLAVGFAAIAGHMFSPFVGFKGGKGVATSLGVFLAVTPLPMLICFAISAAIIGVTGYVSLASITGAVLLPILIFVFSSAEARPWPVIVLTALLGAFVIYKHSANITRLMNGTENKILRKKKPEGA